MLALSWATPYRGFLGRPKAELGVPFKDYISQSGIFAICAFGLLGQAAEWWRMQRRRLAAAALIVAAIFVANIVFMATARSTLLVMAVLLVLFGFLQFRWKGVLAVVLVAVALGGVSWVASPYLRERVSDLVEETQDYRASGAATSVGLRLEFWKKSADFVAAAPLIGHGTGTIAALFRRDSAGDRGAGAVVTDNPHNQILAVAIQLGLVGAAVLIAMWIAHLALFRERTLIAWFGLTIVIGNIVSCLFHTHIVDTGQGWLYVFGVGMLGGAVLGRKANATCRVGKGAGHRVTPTNARPWRRAHASPDNASWSQERVGTAPRDLWILARSRDARLCPPSPLPAANTSGRHTWLRPGAWRRSCPPTRAAASRCACGSGCCRAGGRKRSARRAQSRYRADRRA